MNRFHPLHHLIAACIVLVWGCTFVAIRLGLETLPPIFLTFLRFLFCAVPAIFFLRPPPLPWYQVIAYGVANFACQFGFLFSAMHLGVSPGLASVVLQVQAFITIALGALLLGDRPSRTQAMGAMVAFSGLVVIACNLGGDMPLPGLFLMLLAACSWAGGNIISKGFKVQIDALALVAWGALAAAPVILLMSLLLEGPTRIGNAMQQADWTTVGSVAYLGYASTLVGYSLWNFLLRHYPVPMVAPLTLLVPIVGMGSSALLLGEPMQRWKLLATALIILGLAVNMFGGMLLKHLGRQAHKQD
ncbi:MAG: EamA family transporter [Lautropia sp.]|nr:EamA family transporter [Lautropia sp.]